MNCINFYNTTGHSPDADEAGPLSLLLRNRQAQTNADFEP
jgi:hypothetical protein